MHNFENIFNSIKTLQYVFLFIIIIALIDLQEKEKVGVE